MMKRVLVLSVVLGTVMLPLAQPLWAGDPAAKMAEADSDRAYDAAKRGYWLEAMALWEQALELDPDNAEILNNYAVGLEATGRYEEAGRAYEKALSIDPGSRQIRKNASLAKDFYESYVVVENPEVPEENPDETGRQAAPGVTGDAGVTAGQGGDDE